MPETDAQKERRLAREAQQLQLGTMLIGTDDVRETTDVVIVEVTYGREQRDGTLAEYAGHYTVYVKDDGGGQHPANVASDAVYERWADTYDYFSVDDVRSP